jgi:hypothetical protein
MLEQMLQRRHLRSAARLFARKLPPQLTHDYGTSEYYTPAQIRASVARAKLPESHIDLAYAAFLPKKIYRQLAQPANFGAYEAFKELLAACKPSPQPRWSPESGGDLPQGA